MILRKSIEPHPVKRTMKRNEIRFLLPRAFCSWQIFYAANIIWCFSMDERTNILRILSDRKIFLIKGAVARVARMLGCSEPTVYRGIKSCEAMN